MLSILGHGLRVVIVADGRSPTTASWIEATKSVGIEVELVSTFAPVIDRLTEASVHFLETKKIDWGVPSTAPGGWAAAGVSARRIVTGAGLDLASKALMARNYWELVRIRGHAQRLQRLVSCLKPDLVHALRVPFEGLTLSSARLSGVPLVASTWGNDFSLHLTGNPVIKKQTRRLLAGLDGFLSDAVRDQTTALALGLSPSIPSAVFPGSGGIDRSVFYPGAVDLKPLFELGVKLDAPLVLNPRGYRPQSVRQDRFFQAIDILDEGNVNFQAVCLGMKGVPWAERARTRLRNPERVMLLPWLPQVAVAVLLRAAVVSVSPSFHDGTSNSMLEAMASGVLPIMGDIAPVREWITDGQNGLLVDSNDPASIAVAIRRGLREGDLRTAARNQNLELVSAHADRVRIAPKIAAFYEKVIVHRNATA